MNMHDLFVFRTVTLVLYLMYFRCVGSAIMSRWTELCCTTVSKHNRAVHVQHICSSCVHTMDCTSAVMWRNRHNFTAITSECSKQLWQPVYSMWAVPSIQCPSYWRHSLYFIHSLCKRHSRTTRVINNMQ